MFLEPRGVRQATTAPLPPITPVPGIKTFGGRNIAAYLGPPHRKSIPVMPDCSRTLVSIHNCQCLSFSSSITTVTYSPFFPLPFMGFERSAQLPFPSVRVTGLNCGPSIHRSHRMSRKLFTRRHNYILSLDTSQAWNLDVVTT